MKEYTSTIPQVKLTREKSDFVKVKITGAPDAEQYCRKFFSDDISIYESFFLILLNRANNVIGYAKISQGGCVGTVVDVKIIAKYCIDSLAQSVILCHNHPSGNNKPSEEDKKVTERISQTLRMFDCTVLDHIILTEDTFYSFKDEGIL